MNKISNKYCMLPLIPLTMYKKNSLSLMFPLFLQTLHAEV